mmetsp:Transcript_2553/g.6478  ORF Transcript_2553/g.6478 Transcript_2553/m.6478 type:complete len:212 (+) Transcript_2553:1033-1668(+)
MPVINKSKAFHFQAGPQKKRVPCAVMSKAASRTKKNTRNTRNDSIPVAITPCSTKELLAMSSTCKPVSIALNKMPKSVMVTNFDCFTHRFAVFLQLQCWSCCSSSSRSTLNSMLINCSRSTVMVARELLVPEPLVNGTVTTLPKDARLPPVAPGRNRGESGTGPGAALTMDASAPMPSNCSAKDCVPLGEGGCDTAMPAPSDGWLKNPLWP